MKRTMAATCFVVAGFIGAGGFGQAVADANGAGASAGTTGHARACQVHAENQGNSYARGLQCAPTLTATVLGPGTFGGCAVLVTGTGLKPGSFVVGRVAGQPVLSFTVGVVEPDGTINVTRNVANRMALFVVRATTETGEVIEAFFTPSC